MILGVQIIGVLFGLFLLYMSFLNYKRRDFSIKEVLLWCLVSVFIIIFALVPNFLDPFLKSIGVIRLLDLLVILGILFVLLVSFYTYQITKETHKQVVELARHITMKEATKKKK